ncbi:MAG: DUF2330 domain-containing protein, partial [Myxococcales bacterium]|nr:DUF2330 domain-containing protein [Myxococcales bacterium]
MARGSAVLHGRWVMRLASLATMAVLFGQSGAAHAWATLSKEGGAPRVTREEVLIVWNERTQTEHLFVRSEYDQRNAAGFIVPTPSEPEVTHFLSPVFEGLRGLVVPNPVEREAWTRETWISMWDLTQVWKDAFPEPPPKIEPKKSKGPTVTVTPLSAKDAKAQAAWSAAHGLEMREAVSTWMQDYVDAGWVLTALDVERAPDARSDRALRTPVVRLSFKTPHPVFPYSEPSDVVSSPKRLLRLLVVSDARVAGALRGQRRWTSRVRYARPVQDAHIFSDVLPASEFPATPWLTVLDAPGKRQAGVLLDFVRAPKQTTVVPKIEEIVTPIRLPP